MRTRYDDTVATGVGSAHTGDVKPSLEEQFRELALYFRERAREEGFSYLYFQGIFKNSWNGSMKMRCWLAREVFDEMSRFYGRAEMPGKERNGKQDGGKLDDWGFVNVQLSDEEREAAMLDYADSDTLWDAVVVCLSDGYKVTLSVDPESGSFCAALSGTNCGKPNERLTLPAWGDNETDALKYLMYKHVTKLAFVWKKAGERPKRLG